MMYGRGKHVLCDDQLTTPAQAIDEIGFTLYQWKLFFLNGFGCV